MCRHGARLDAADTQWHLTSPTPYDPPLTYGGWRQSQALGARIASIIQNREADSGSHAVHPLNGRSEAERYDARQGSRRASHSNRTRQRKHKVVVHSSPFLRCVQTSIAICAGMAQYQAEPKANGHYSHSRTHVMHSGSPHLHAMDDGNSRRLSAIPEPETYGTSRRRNRLQTSRSTSRTLLRVDPFLGEWLSPEYFDKITPPPDSRLMVASAKGELLREADPIDMLHIAKRNVTGQASLLWGGVSPSTKSQSSDEDTPLNDMTSLSNDMPRLGHATSHSLSNSPVRSNLKPITRGDMSLNPETSYYVPPIPSYAVSPSQPIPQGYVTHARDACVNVDYQWDSLRPPLEWGHGGNFGEEWSNMHKRFRRGLNEMILWYRNHETSETLEPIRDGSPQSQTSSATWGSQTTQCSEDSDDDDVDTVLVLVTHGAGCNALIGALTNQPVLIDVGMASLTMAVRKRVDYKRVSSPPNYFTSSPSRRRHSVVDLGLSEEYEVKNIASTDHLRPGSPFLAGPKVQVRETSPYRYERPGFTASNFSASSIIAGDYHGDSDGSDLTPISNRFAGLQRSATTAVHSSGGLWTKPDAKELNGTAEEGTKSSITSTKAYGLDGTTEDPKLGQAKGNAATGDIENKRLVDGTSLSNGNQGHSIIINGLWGAPPQALPTERDEGPKRRWTLSQAS